MTVDASNNVYVAGITFGAFPGQSSPGLGDAFVRKFDPSGNELWTRQFGSTDSIATTGALAVAVDRTGNVTVVGYTDDTLPGQTSAGNDDAFVRKYDANGNELWTRQFGSSMYDRADGVAVDAAGNVYIAASFDSGVSDQTNDIVIRKYGANGAELWTRRFGASGNDIACDVVADAAGNIYVAASINGDWKFEHDGLVRKYDTNGTEVWSRVISSGADDRATAIALDGSGYIYVAGWAVDPLPGHKRYTGDIFVRKYDASGTESWTHQFGPNVFDRGEGVAVGPSGQVYVAGYTAGTFPGETRLYPTDYDDDTFVARLSQAGAPAAGGRVKVYLPLTVRNR